MAEDMGEKTEQPTARRRGQARSRGQVAKSPDLAAAIDLIGATIALVVLGGWLCAGLASILRRVLSGDAPGSALTPDGAAPAMLDALSHAGWLLVPFLIAAFVVGIFSQTVQFGWLWTTKPLRPNLNKLNPMGGLKRIIGVRNLVKTLASVVKLVVIGGIVWLIVRRDLEKLAALALLDLKPALVQLGLMVLELVTWMLLILLVLGIVDYIYHRWQHTKDLKMTKHEVKDERRAVEGDPEVKSRLARMARQIAMQRIQSAVPKADVVVTNPTHFAVALRYDPETMKAPRLVAKGADLVALRIRQIAAASGVAIVERPPLARALYAQGQVGREVAPKFYEAVAEVLAYVYRMEQRAA